MVVTDNTYGGTFRLFERVRRRSAGLPEDTVRARLRADSLAERLGYGQ